MKSKSLVGIAVILISLSGGCASYQSIKKTGDLPEETKRVGKFALNTYCENLTNVRRLTLRFIRAFDPQWVSVCEEYLAAKEASVENSPSNGN